MGDTPVSCLSPKAAIKDGLRQPSARRKRVSCRRHAMRALDLRVELRRLVAVGHAVIANDADPSVAQLAQRRLGMRKCSSRVSSLGKFVSTMRASPCWLCVPAWSTRWSQTGFECYGQDRNEEDRNEQDRNEVNSSFAVRSLICCGEFAAPPSATLDCIRAAITARMFRAAAAGSNANRREADVIDQGAI
jgi:hypothetical protein